MQAIVSRRVKTTVQKMLAFISFDAAVKRYKSKLSGFTRV